MKNKKVVFMGTPEFSIPVLEALIKETNVILVVTQPDKCVGRKQELTFSPVKKLAIQNNIEVFQPIKIREDYQRILDVKPDIIVTCAFGQIIPDILLETPPFKAINVHGSLLPKLRGGAPIHKAIIDGYKETGITIMYMSSGMDAGNIISQRSIKIEDKDNVGTLHNKLSIIGKELLMETLPLIFEGKNESIVQNEEEVTFAYNIKKEEELLNFDKNANEVHNQIRGLYPWPISYCILNNENIKIIESEIATNGKGKIGEIINIYDNGIGIMCKDKEIIIKKLKPAGKNEMTAKDFINGYKNKLLGSVVNEVL